MGRWWAGALVMLYTVGTHLISGREDYATADISTVGHIPCPDRCDTFAQGGFALLNLSVGAIPGVSQLGLGKGL